MKRQKRYGFVGKTHSGEINLIVNIKRNQEGAFLSLLFISNAFIRVVRMVCIPMGGDLLGWMDLSEALSSVLLEVDAPPVKALVFKPKHIASSLLEKVQSGPFFIRVEVKQSGVV